MKHRNFLTEDRGVQCRLPLPGAASSFATCPASTSFSRSWPAAHTPPPKRRKLDVIGHRVRARDCVKQGSDRQLGAEMPSSAIKRRLSTTPPEVSKLAPTHKHAHGPHQAQFPITEDDWLRFCWFPCQIRLRCNATPRLVIPNAPGPNAG